MALPTLQLIPRHMNSPIDEIRNAGADDVLVAITFTPYSRDTIEACKYAQSKGMKLILNSDSDFVVPELTPEVTLIAILVARGAR
jgi:DNA-binding MurR/RpiR family transcriptional regulator